VSALRALFARAAAAGLVTTNRALALTKPRRTRSRRRALDDAELAELIDAVRTTSNDPDLDLLVVRFHLESGARREGALTLRRRDLDTQRATTWLREKGGAEREQPVSPGLAVLLERHATTRGATAPGDAVFRTARGAPLSPRRHSTICDRARPCLDWADRTPVSAHVLRHTAITAVGRLAGYPVAQAFAGHSPPSVTGLYLQASLAEVAAAVATLTGEAHPLASTQRPPYAPTRRMQPSMTGPACCVALSADLVREHVAAVLDEKCVVVPLVGIFCVVLRARRRSIGEVLVGVDRAHRTDIGLVARSAGRAFLEVHVQDALPEDSDRTGIREVGGFDDAAARFVLGEQHVLLRIELVDALHRADIDAGSILHVDAGFGDDRETGHGSAPRVRR
jgi:site-specific recombinase XerD